MQKIGGIAAICAATAYIVGFVVMFTLLVPDSAEVQNATQRLGFLIERQAVVVAWNFFIYVFFGVVLVVLALALHERLDTGSAVMKVATVFGLIWAGLVIAAGMIANTGLTVAAKLYSVDPVQAAALWQSVATVQEGIGGGVELVGGLWMILIGWSALRLVALPSFLTYLGIAVGIAGVLTVIPMLQELGAIFGVGQIVWFVWLASVMLRPQNLKLR